MRKIDAVIFDMDGTLVRYHGVNFESSWGAVSVAAGVSERSQELFRAYFHRKDAYAEWVIEEAKLFKGIPVAQVTDRLFPPPYALGVVEAVAKLHGDYLMGILSSGVDLVANYVAKDLGLTFAVANSLVAADGHFVGTSETLVDLWSKADVLEQLAAKYELELERICFIGDNLNDLPVMERVGLSIAANPKNDALLDVADHVITDFADLPGLIRAYEAAG